MSAMSEPLYLIHAGRAHHHAQDWTPYSAVSSFNLPAQYDSSLVTPVSMTESLSMPIKSAPVMSKDKDLKLSPSAISPNYHFLCSDEDYGNSRYNPPMKHKDPTTTLHISTADSSFPVSPFVCSSPYWGAFGVSATPGSGRAASDSSPSMNPSSSLNSAGGASAGSHRSRHQTPAQSATSYRGQNHAPILIAPNPSTLRPATTQEGGPYRQNSLQSNHSTPHSQGSTEKALPEPLGSTSTSRKRKTPPRNAHEGDILLSGEVNYEEQVLMQLAEHDQLPWKEVAQIFNERTGKSMKVPALQMRKKRLRERLRIWTELEERALTLAWEDYDKLKWETIASDMLKHGCSEKWTKEAVQRKWNEMHPEDAPYIPEYEATSRNRARLSGEFKVEPNTLSDERNSASHSLQDGDTGTLLSAISTTTMDEARSRAASDASSQMQLQRQQQQQQIMFEQQHSNVWSSAS